MLPLCFCAFTLIYAISVSFVGFDGTSVKSLSPGSSDSQALLILSVIASVHPSSEWTDSALKTVLFLFM